MASRMEKNSTALVRLACALANRKRNDVQRNMNFHFFIFIFDFLRFLPSVCVLYMVGHVLSALIFLVHLVETESILNIFPIQTVVRFICSREIKLVAPIVN